MDNPFGKAGEIVKPSINPFEEAKVTLNEDGKVSDVASVEVKEPEFKQDVIKEEVKVATPVVPPPMSNRAKVLAEFGGLESNVPINHGYWKMKG